MMQLGEMLKKLHVSTPKQWNPGSSGQGVVKPDLLLVSSDATYAKTNLHKACDAFWSHATPKSTSTRDLAVPAHHYFIAEISTQSEKMNEKLFQIEKDLTVIDHATKNGNQLFSQNASEVFAAVIVDGSQDSFESECQKFASLLGGLTESFLGDAWIEGKLMFFYAPFRDPFSSERKLEEKVDHNSKVLKVVRDEHTQLLDKYHSLMNKDRNLRKELDDIKKLLVHLPIFCMEESHKSHTN